MIDLNSSLIWSHLKSSTFLTNSTNPRIRVHWLQTQAKYAKGIGQWENSSAVQSKLPVQCMRVIQNKKNAKNSLSYSLVLKDDLLTRKEMAKSDRIS